MDQPVVRRAAYPDFVYNYTMGAVTERSTLFNLVCSLSEAMDLVSPLLVDHHMRTAWFAVHMAREMGLEEKRIKRTLFAALMHDVGAFSLRERLDTLHFEFENPHHHACLGFTLLKDFTPLRKEARIILAHHTWWRPEREGDVGGEQVPLESHLIHLADRLAILMDEDENIWDQAEAALGFISGRKETMFMPDAVDTLMSLGSSKEFWVGAFEPDLKKRLEHKGGRYSLEMSREDLQQLAGLFARIIDYRSPYTATHSAGVAVIAESLARALGFTEENCGTMKLAGYLHDLGKLAIPTSILDKPGRLSEREYHRIQDHVVYTKTLLEKVPELGYGIRWASQHHERLNGTGYPEHSRGGEIAFGSRVVAMADMFTAITEDRPYRKGMGREQALRILARFTREGYLDPEIFQVVEDNFEELNRKRDTAQKDRLEDYRFRVECFADWEPASATI